LNTTASKELKRWRSNLSRVGYVLVGGSVLMAVALWYSTCAMGGFHCFDGTAGDFMEAAQLGMVAGFFCSLFGEGMKRFVFAGIALFELVFCYAQLLVH